VESAASHYLDDADAARVIARTEGSPEREFLAAMAQVAAIQAVAAALDRLAQAVENQRS
jgi:hypothetical protein